MEAEVFVGLGRPPLQNAATSGVSFRARPGKRCRPRSRPMTTRRFLSLATICLALFRISLGETRAQQQKAPSRIFNTAKQKLREGKTLVGATVFSPDPNIYCAMANAGYDYLWIEMQHSPLTYEDVAKMIWACRGASGCRLFACRTRPKATSRKRPTSARWGSSFPRWTPSRRRRPR